MDLRDFQELRGRLERDHGAVIGITARDPYLTKDPIYGNQPNPTPTYRYTFQDGTYIDVLGTGGRSDSSEAENYDVVGGTALSSSAKAQDEAPKTITTADGRTLQWDAERRDWKEIGAKEVIPKGQDWKPVYYPGTQILMGMQDSAGNYRDITDAERRLLSDAGVGLAGGGLAGAGGTGTGGVGRTEFESERALREAQAETERAQRGYYEAQAEKIRRELEPSYGRMLQDYYDSVSRIQGMIESGQMSVAEADAYMDLFRQNMAAALQGTTPFQQAQDRANRETERAGIGRDLLNQRLQSSTSLAQSLINMFSNNLDTLGWGLQPGQTVQLDPFALARSYTDERGGGQEMGELGRALLATIQPGAAGQGAAVPAASPKQPAYSAPNSAGLNPALVMAVQMAEEVDRRAMGQGQGVNDGQVGG